MTQQTTPSDAVQWNWRPIETARKGELVVVRGPDLPEQQSIWSKVSHVPICGWLDLSGDDPEDVDLLRPQPTEWRFLVEETDI